MTPRVEVGMSEIRRAWSLSERDGFGHFDSLVLASTLSAGSSALHTEGLQLIPVPSGKRSG